MVSHPHNSKFGVAREAAAKKGGELDIRIPLCRATGQPFVPVAQG